MMSLFGNKKNGEKKNDGDDRQDTPEVRMLKDVWDIKPEKKDREVVQGPVSSDIYARGQPPRGIPPRHRGRRIED